MTLRCVLFGAALSVLTASSALGAPPQGPQGPQQGRARRVVVAGPQEDVIAARVQKELTALGFEAVRVGALEGCARSAVIVAALDSDAIAAACSDGDQVGVWVADGTSTLRLRDVVAAREDAPANPKENDRGRETIAVRAAEVTRATIALREAEEDAARAAPPASPSPATTTSAPTEGWENLDRSEAKPEPARKPIDRRTPRFNASVGASALMGIDATVGALSGQIAVGVFKRLSVAARIEYPFESQRLSSNVGLVHVSPAFAGAGLELPLFAPTSFIIPRFGAGVGAAWMRVEKRAVDAFFSNNASSIGPDSSDTIASPAGYVSAGLSMRVFGPMRLMVDGLFGTTLGRFVARDQGEEVAYWGQPLAALALRAEVMLP
jgi:hypothetical protein